MKQEKERILKLVEEGKLTAQEALTLIEKLDSDYKEKEEKITALSVHVHDEEEPFTAEKKESSKPSLGAKLFDWIDSAVKKVKEVDLDLNFGHAYDVQHIFQFKDTDFSSVELQIANGSVNIVLGKTRISERNARRRYIALTARMRRDMHFFSILNVKSKEISFLSVLRRKQ